MQSPARLVLLGALVLLVSLTAGLVLGRTARAPGDRGPASLAITLEMAGSGLLPGEKSPQAVIARDGRLAWLGVGGYRVLAAGDRLALLLEAWAIGAPGWADGYPVPGGEPIRRMTLETSGPDGRRVVIEDPSSNTGLPDPLYRLCILVLRDISALAAADIDRAGTPLVPGAVVLRAHPSSATGPAQRLPFPVDAAALRAGLTVRGSALEALRAAWPGLDGRLAFPDNRVEIEAGGERLTLVLSPDWGDWAR